jgi:hypothetical protein
VDVFSIPVEDRSIRDEKGVNEQTFVEQPSYIFRKSFSYIFEIKVYMLGKYYPPYCGNLLVISVSKLQVQVK